MVNEEGSCKISADKLIQQPIPPSGSPFDVPTVAIAVIRVDTIIKIDYYHGMDASQTITCQKSYNAPVVGFAYQTSEVVTLFPWVGGSRPSVTNLSVTAEVKIVSQI